MNYKHPNLFVMIPYEERNRVSGYFDLSVVGEEYAKLLGDLTDELSTYAVSKNDVGENAVIIPILRAGMSMSNRLTKRLPKADVARISMRRNLHTLKPFVAELRKKYQTVPIFIISKIIFSLETHFSKDAEEECMIRSYQEEFVKTCSIFDKNIYYIDGRTLLGDDFNEKTVDGVHPNDYGFASIARTIENKIKEKL